MQQTNQASTLIAYRSYFQVSRNGRTVTMTLTNPLPDTILQSNAFITLVIVATVQDNDDLTGYTVLIISLPESDDTSTVGKIYLHTIFVNTLHYKLLLPQLYQVLLNHIIMLVTRLLKTNMNSLWKRLAFHQILMPMSLLL